MNSDVERDKSVWKKDNVRNKIMATFQYWSGYASTKLAVIADTEEEWHSNSNLFRMCSHCSYLPAFERSNKYFSRIMSLTGPESSDYKIAKSRIVNV